MKRFPSPSSISTRANKRRRSRSNSSCSAGSADEARSRIESTGRPLKVYIVQAKLDEQTIAELYGLIESTQVSKEHHLELEICNQVEDADIILTVIQMRKRLERHVDWRIAVCNSAIISSFLPTNFSAPIAATKTNSHSRLATFICQRR